MCSDETLRAAARLIAGGHAAEAFFAYFDSEAALRPLLLATDARARAVGTSIGRVWTSKKSVGRSPNYDYVCGNCGALWSKHLSGSTGLGEIRIAGWCPTDISSAMTFRTFRPWGGSDQLERA